MDIPDVLAQICVRLDDVTLFQFARIARLWEEVARLLRNNLFWKRRTEHLAGHPLDSPKLGIWMRAYYAILSMEDSEFDDSEDEVMDLDLLLIMFQVRPTDQREMRGLMKNGIRTSGEVFRYLLDTGLVAFRNDDKVVSQLYALMQSDFSTADEPEEGPILVSLMSAEYQTHDQERLSGLRDDLADSGYTNTLSAILDKYETNNDALLGLVMTANHRREDATTAMLIKRTKLS